MCGIVGGTGAAVAGNIERMVAALAHRGPDDRGVWIEPSGVAALAQARLSIIDLSAAGHQPMVDASGRYNIVYNGELYNYRELGQELRSAGAELRGHSDTEVLLEHYARRGTAILPRLNGIFALAIWDRDSRELLLARDALGVKPLYYASTANGLAFASELKALLPVLPSRRLDAAALQRYLTYLWCPGEGTPLREVRKLLPGQAMRVAADGRILQHWTWYELPARRLALAPLKDGADQIARQLAEGVRKAVQRQMVADVPVGAFLSGGLDSSAIAAFAREVQPGIACFTIEMAGGQDAGFADDLPYARRVAKHLDLPLAIVQADASRMAGEIEQMIWQLDEPLADPAPLNVLHISRLAREQGIKVLLSGAGGDDLFTGYRRHLALNHERWWSWLPAQVRAGIQSAANALPGRSALGRRAQRLGAPFTAEGDARMAAYFAWGPSGQAKTLLNPDLRRELDGPADAPLIDFLAGMSPQVPPMERMLALEQRFFLADHNLAYTDRMSMATGVEVRVPLLDLELVDLAARIPHKLKQHGRTGKWIFKKAMEPYLPADVIYRPKTGFGAPLRRWLQHELAPLADELLAPEALRRRGVFDADAVARLRREDASGRVDAAYTIFSILTIEIWCRRFLDS